MKVLTIYKQLFFLLIFFGLTNAALAQEAWNENTATAWLNKKEWKKGLKLDAHSSINKVEFAEQYHKNQAAWDKAFAFLRDSDLTKLKPGKYPIDGTNVYASITEAPSKEFENSAWESHRNYIDL